MFNINLRDNLPTEWLFSMKKRRCTSVFTTLSQLICCFCLLMSLCSWFACCLFCLSSSYKLVFSRQGAYCWVPNNVFPLTDSCVSGGVYNMMVDYFAWFVFIFCIEWDHSFYFSDMHCHFASHACLLVASCCLPDPLNAPLCSYVDMAPSAVGHCPFCVSAEVRFIITSVLSSTNSQDCT